FRHTSPLKFGWAGIVGSFKCTLIERFILSREVVAEHAGLKPQDRLKHHHRSYLATHQDKITDRDFTLHIEIDYPLVDPFVSSTEIDMLWLLGQTNGVLLCKSLSLGCKQGNFSPGAPKSCLSNRECERFRFHHHSRATTIGRIIY